MAIIETISVGSRPHSMVEGLGSVWVTNEGDAVAGGTVSRIDPITRQQSQPPIEVGLAPIELAVGTDRVFVANYNGRGIPDRPGTVTVLGVQP